MEYLGGPHVARGLGMTDIYSTGYQAGIVKSLKPTVLKINTIRISVVDSVIIVKIKHLKDPGVIITPKICHCNKYILTT